jgi:hypothetical protein
LQPKPSNLSSTNSSCDSSIRAASSSSDPPTTQARTESKLPYALEDLPELLCKIKKPKWPFTVGTYCQPVERVPVKKTIIQAYKIHERIVMLESFLHQA